VQVGSPVKPVTSKFASSVSEALESVALAVPLAQLSETVTEPPLSGMKFLFTLNVAELSVFVIVQEPVPELIVPLQVPAGEPLAL
jgi:hypothetical protein